MKKPLLTFLLLFILHQTFSQSNWYDQNKYWYYRYRLVKDFLARGEENPLNCLPGGPGSGSGYSIPAGHIWSKGTKPGDDNIVIDVDMYWGDGTTYLGWYIGVLATEYKLLLDNNQSTTATLKELYYAMKAYERLDRKSEKIYTTHMGVTSDCSLGFLNGIFVRDDVAQETMDQLPELVAKYSVDDGQFVVHSDFENSLKGTATTLTKEHNIFPTQDQIACLFMGFALVKKCVGNLTYNGYNFLTNASLYTEKIANRLVSTGWVGKVPQIDLEYYNGKTIRDEFCSYGIAVAANSITGQDHTGNLQSIAKNKWDLLSKPVIGPAIMDASFDGLSINIDVPWEPYTIPVVNTTPVDFTIALEMMFAAVGNSWTYSVIPTRRDFFFPKPTSCFDFSLNVPGFPEIIPLPPICVPWLPPGAPEPQPIEVNVTEEFLSSYGMEYRMHFFSLLHEYLYGDGSRISTSHFLSSVQSAPCEGPQYKPRIDPNNIGQSDWRAFNRWERPIMSREGRPEESQQGKYNGLDYMLYYNLYRLSRGLNDSDYRNSLNKKILANVEVAGKYWAYESIELSGTVVNNNSTSAGLVEFSANNSIVLKQGFKIEEGAKTKMYLGNYTACNTTMGQNAGREATPTEATPAETAILGEELQQNAMDDIYAEIKRQYDSIAAFYAQYQYDKDDLTEKSPFIKGDRWAIYPNPITKTCSVTVILERDQNVEVVFSDIYNTERATMFNGELKAGVNNIDFDISKFKNGLMYVEIKCAELNEIKKIVKKAEE